MRKGHRRIGRGAEVSSPEGCGSQNFGLGVLHGVPVRPACVRKRERVIHSTSISSGRTLGRLRWFGLLRDFPSYPKNL